MKNFLNEIKKTELKKDWKSRSYQYGFAIIAFEFISGTYLLFIDQLNNIDQFLLLFHLLLGFLLCFSLYAFFQRFLLYRTYWKDHLFTGLGSLTSVCFFSSLMSGMVLFFTGVSAFKWLWLTHIVSSYLFSLCMLAFVGIIIFRAFDPLENKVRKALKRMLSSIVLRVNLIALLLIGISLGSSFLYFEPDPSFRTTQYKRPFSNSPFFPSPVRTKEDTFYKKETFANSKSCGVSGCHTGIYNQWEESAHYRTPNVFVHAVQKELIKEGKEKRIFDKSTLEHIKKINERFVGREAFRACAGCHAPVALISGNVDLSKPIETYQEFEGASCTLCHSIESTGIRGGGDFVVNTQKQYLFSDSTNKIGQYIHETLIRNKPEFHKSTYNKPAYKETRYCVSCHERLHYKSWNESPYHDLKNPEKTKHCQSCHMPQVAEHGEVSAVVKGTVADHRFLSGGLTLARYYGKENQFNKTVDFLKDKKIDLTIIAPTYVDPEKRLDFIIRNANVGVGHNFPAGPEADLVEAWVQLEVRNKKGELILEKGKLSNDNYLDKKNNFVYFSRPFDSNGNELESDKHRSWRFVEDRHQVIAPRMFHDLTFSLKIKPNEEGPITIKAKFMYRRPNQEFADWALGKGVFVVPSTVMDEEEFTIMTGFDALKLKKAAEEFTKSATIEVLQDGVRKMHAFPDPDFQIDMESRLILQHAYDYLKNGKMHKAIETIEHFGPAAKKTKAYKEFYMRINKIKLRGKNGKK